MAPLLLSVSLSLLLLLLAPPASHAVPLRLVYPAAPPRLGYAFGKDAKGELIAAPAAAARDLDLDLTAAAQPQPRAAHRPESPHLIGRAAVPTGTTPQHRRSDKGHSAPQPTQAPVILRPNPTPNEIYEFYGPIPDTPERLGPAPDKVQGAFFDWYEPEHESPSPSTSTPTTKISRRDDEPPVPTSQLPYPTFPASIASCQKCEPNYPKISSCAMASSAFQNGTTIFSDPTKYYSIIKCACADTFQAAYPQCLDCFQHTNQCWYLGTDPQGSQAPAIISNMRSICALGSALLGGVASTNQGGWNYTFTPGSPGTYTDVSSYAPGYIDQGAGPLFQSASMRSSVASVMAVVFAGLVAVVVSTL